MSYTYQKCSGDELEQIAGIVFTRYSKWRNGCFVDIEGIIEACELTVIPRPGLRKLVNGYAPTDPHFIVVEESYGTYPPFYRSILAEEFCHILLEYDLLTIGKIPNDAQPHNLTFQQHQAIEQEAKYLARAILMPKEIFIQKWNECFEKAPAEEKSCREKHLIFCAEKLETTFVSWPLTIAYRARDLKIITDEECRNFFSEKIPI